MANEELIQALDRLKVQTGSLACLGCGYEHNCSTKGCRILREAVEQLSAPVIRTRAAASDKPDNFVDLAGYAACAGEAAQKRDGRNEERN